MLNIYLFIYFYLFIYLYIYIYLFIFIYLFIYIYIFIYFYYLFIYIYIFIYLFIYIYLFFYLFIYQTGYFSRLVDSDVYVIINNERPRSINSKTTCNPTTWTQVAVTSTNTIHVLISWRFNINYFEDH